MDADMSKKKKDRYSDSSFHLIGVGGTGMRAIAEMLMNCGAMVSGSDLVSSEATDRLVKMGADISIGQKGENLPEPCDVVVYSAAVRERNPELLEARQRGLEVIKYAEMLGRMMADRVGITISGTHGKSTVTAMVAYVLKEASKDPSFIVGADVRQLGGPSGVGSGELFVAEACEYDRSFLHLHPKYAAILNIEEDHLDCYRDLESIIESFRAYASKIGNEDVLVANGEDRNVADALSDLYVPVETFGMTEDCLWRGVIVNPDRGYMHMDIIRAGKAYGTMRVPLPGVHNAYNCLAATALLANAGLSSDETIKHLEKFEGTGRRIEYRGEAAGVTIIDDYAHHPTEIQASLRAIANCYNPKRIICVFQPHQHSRTRFLLKDFAQSFALADEVVLPDIYFVRDSQYEQDYISSKDLVAQIRLRGGIAIYLKTFNTIVEYIEGIAEPGDLVVTMGAGDIWKVADEIIKRLGKDSQGK